MIEATITADDLALYALDLLEGEERVHVEAMLRKSTAAREELANIRGDLAMFAMAAEQHTPPALTRQRLLKQVARERRTMPVELPLEHGKDAGDRRAFAEGATGSDARAAHRGNGDRDSRSREISLRDPEARTSGASRSGIRLASERSGGFGRGSGEATRAQRPMPSEPAPPHEPVGGAVPGQARTLLGRSQVRTAALTGSTGLPVPRLLQEPEEISAELPVTSLAVDAAGPAADRATFSAERTAFSPDPQVFPREARTTGASAPAYSTTIFEKHFGTDAPALSLEPELPPDPDAYSGRTHAEADAAEATEDRLVPSIAAHEESFGFSSYRDRDAEEARSGGLERWLGWAGWVVAAAVAMATMVVLRDEFRLRDQVADQQSTLLATQVNAGRAESVLQTLESPSSQHFLVSRTDTAAAPSGRVAYLPERGAMIFQGSNLETLQPYKTYELWLIPVGEGRPPVPAGLFKPDGHGYATVVLPQMQQGLVAANFGVTIEDEGGSATPTLPIILIGQPGL